MKKTLKDFDFYEKRVLLRVDFNVPMKDGKITDDTRIVEALPTIKYLLNSSAKVIVCSHLGRPDGQVVPKYSLKPVFELLKKLLPHTVMSFSKDIVGEKVINKTNKMKKSELLLLENLRFMKEEEENNEDFALNLSKLADIFVLDAFGTAHRKHASTYGVSKFLPSCMGLLVQKELNVFDETLSSPKRPFVAILGGAKIEDKLLVTENLLSKVNTMLIGGGMCFTFIKALKGNVGKSIVDESKVDFCYEVIRKALEQKVRIVLPVDFVCAKGLDDENFEICKLSHMKDDMMGLDIGPKTVKLFSKYLKKAKTIIWNGPLGAYEYPQYANGTKCVAEVIAKNKKCKAIIGGGDVVSAIENLGLSENFYHISTGGGASLKLMEGKTLAGVEALSDVKEGE
ncbi:MAG: phosphoglycerate kinase [Clostridiales bacterium]|nr:phosphoglycerate kinase [Candidatus Apopatousia equi]